MTDLSSNLSGEKNAAVERLSVEPLPERSRRPALKAVESGQSTNAGGGEPLQSLAVEQQIIAEVAELRALVHRRRSVFPDHINAVFAAIAKVLAVRLQLLLSLIGAFVLALGAMRSQDWPGLSVLIAFCGLTILPLVWLEYSGRPRG